MTMTGINKKRLIIRIVLVVLMILLCFVLFYLSKEHDVLLDNKTVLIEGHEYREIKYMNVIIDGKKDKAMEFYAGDRDAVKLKGPKHKIKITVLNEDTEEIIKTVESSLDLGTASRIMYSLPAITAGAHEIKIPLPGSGL